MTTTTAEVEELSPLQKIVADMKGFARKPSTPPALTNFIENYLVEALKDLDERVTDTEIAVEEEDDGAGEALVELAEATHAAISNMVLLADAAQRAVGWINDEGMTDSMPEDQRTLYTQTNEMLAAVSLQVRAVLDPEEEAEGPEEPDQEAEVA